MASQEIPGGPMVVILNPESGSSDDDYREEVEKALRRRGAAYEIRETSKEKDGKALAKEARAAGTTCVMACGGDGTVAAVINGLGANREGVPPVTLAIVPGGTANLIAAALEIPTEIEAAVAVALDGRERDVDLGRRDDTLFALGVGVGLTERLVSQASSEAKEKMGRWAYVLALLKEVGAKPHRFEMCLDEGQRVRAEGVAVVIANTGTMGHGMNFAPEAKLDDGKLDVCVLGQLAISDLLRLGLRLLTGCLTNDRDLAFYQARRVEIEADPPLEVQIDGEPVEAKTPIVAEIVPKGLRVRVPKD